MPLSSHRYLLVLLCLLATATATRSVRAALPTTDERTPWNFVLILADDQGWGDLACFGGEKIKTPHIDKMAKEGMKFTSFYSQMVCGPTRTSLHTGCYPIRVAEMNNRKHYMPFVHPKEIFLGKKLQEIGYRTGWIGKIDTTNRQRGHTKALSPIRRGYDYWYGVISSNDNGYVRQLYRNDELLAKTVRDLAHITQNYTKEALAFLDRNKDKPFLLYVAHAMPHVRIARSPAFVGVSERGLYGDVIEELDWSTGQIIQKLKDLGLDKKTIVIYTSDNGAFAGIRLPEESGSNGPLRGSKATSWEGGVRVPCVMWAPGFIPADTSTDEIASMMDIFPTFISIAGAQLPQDRVIDGKDLTRLMTGKPNAKSPHQYIAHYHESELEAVRSGKWKLVRPYGKLSERPWLHRNGASQRKYAPGTFDGLGRVGLFNMETDIGETTNVADEHPEVVARMQTYVDEILVELGDYRQIGKGARFFEEGPRWSNWAAGKKYAKEQPKKNNSKK